MRALSFVGCLCAILIPKPGLGQAVVVPDDNVRLRPIFVDDELLNVSRAPWIKAEDCEDPFCSYVVFHYEDGVLDFGTNQFAGISGDWFLVSAGDIFSEATKDTYSAMFVNFRPAPPTAIGTEDFYLAVWQDRFTYGWVQVRPIDGLVTMVANAVAYNSRGIVVGTLDVAPEPTSMAIAILGLGALFRYRK